MATPARVLRLWVVACALLAAAETNQTIEVEVDLDDLEGREEVSTAVYTEAHSKPTVVFGWRVGPGSGWGMLGVNLMTTLASRGWPVAFEWNEHAHNISFKAEPEARRLYELAASRPMQHEGGASDSNDVTGRVAGPYV